MGNLDRIGVAVVVVLLSVIIVVSFIAGDGDKETPSNSDKGKQASVDREKGSPEIKNDGTSLSSNFENRRSVDDNVLSMGPTTEESGNASKNGGDGSSVLANNDGGSIILDDDGSSAKDLDPGVITPTPAPEPLAQKGDYPRTVKLGNGESLWVLAEREYGASVGPNMIAAIVKANGIQDERRLKDGMSITLPAPIGSSTSTAKTDPAKEPADVAKSSAGSASSKKSEATTKASSAPRRTAHFPPFDPAAASGIIIANDTKSGPDTLVSAPDTPDTHRVQNGETLGHIALKRLGSTRFVKDIMQLNGIKDARRVRDGQVLKLPVVKN